MSSLWLKSGNRLTEQQTGGFCSLPVGRDTRTFFFSFTAWVEGGKTWVTDHTLYDIEHLRLIFEWKYITYSSFNCPSKVTLWVCHSFMVGSDVVKHTFRRLHAVRSLLLAVIWVRWRGVRGRLALPFHGDGNITALQVPTGIITTQWSEEASWL